MVEWDRFDTVFRKIAQGHRLYETAQPISSQRIAIRYTVIDEMKAAGSHGVAVSSTPLLPEVGSRALERLARGPGPTVIQEGRFEFQTTPQHLQLKVRGVLIVDAYSD